MASLSASYHFFQALRRAAGRVLLTFLITLIVVGGGTALVYALLAPHGIDVLGYILAAVLGVGWAVALSLIVLVGEIVRGLVAGVKDTVQDVKKEVGDVGSLVSGLGEHRDKK